MSMNFTRMAAVAAIALSSSATFAYHNGFYIGLNTGAAFVTGQTNDTLSYGDGFGGTVLGFVPNDVNFRDEASARGFIGGATIGWSFYCDNEYIYSLELNGTGYTNRAYQTFWTLGYANTEAQIDALNYEESWDLTYSADLVFKPGYFVSDTTQLFGIVGASVAQLNTRIKNLSLNTVFDNDVSDEDNKVIWGFVLGAGIQKQLSNCLSFYTSYQYTYYGKQDLGNATSGLLSEIPQARQTQDDLTTNLDRSIRVDSNVFKVGFTYTFPI